MCIDLRDTSEAETKCDVVETSNADIFVIDTPENPRDSSKEHW